jgi:hypothetical protein
MRRLLRRAWELRRKLLGHGVRHGRKTVLQLRTTGREVLFVRTAVRLPATERTSGGVRAAGWLCPLLAELRRLLRPQRQLPTWIHQRAMRRDGQRLPELHDRQFAIDVRVGRFAANLREPARAMPGELPELPSPADAARSRAAKGLLDGRSPERRCRMRRRCQHDVVQRVSELREQLEPRVRKLLGRIRFRFRDPNWDSRVRRAVRRRDLQSQQRVHRRLRRAELLRVRRFGLDHAVRDASTIRNVLRVFHGRPVRHPGLCRRGRLVQSSHVPRQLRRMVGGCRHPILRTVREAGGSRSIAEGD